MGQSASVPAPSSDRYKLMEDRTDGPKTPQHYNEMKKTKGLDLVRAMDLVMEFSLELATSPCTGTLVMRRKEALNSKNATLAFAWTFLHLHATARAMGHAAENPECFDIVKNRLCEELEVSFPCLKENAAAKEMLMVLQLTPT